MPPCHVLFGGDVGGGKEAGSCSELQALRKKGWVEKRSNP